MTQDDVCTGPEMSGDPTSTWTPIWWVAGVSRPLRSNPTIAKFPRERVLDGATVDHSLQSHGRGGQGHRRSLRVDGRSQIGQGLTEPFPRLVEKRVRRIGQTIASVRDPGAAGPLGSERVEQSPTSIRGAPE